MVCCPDIFYPNQLNRVERVRFEGDLQELENRHFHACLSLRGGGASRNNYGHWKLGYEVVDAFLIWLCSLPSTETRDMKSVSAMIFCSIMLGRLYR